MISEINKILLYKIITKFPRETKNAPWNLQYETLLCVDISGVSVRISLKI